MDHLTLFVAWHDINYASRIFYVMLNMDQYGSTYKKCDVHHIIGIKLQDTRTPRTQRRRRSWSGASAPHHNSKAWNTHAPPVSCPPGGGDLDSTVRALPPCTPWHHSKFFPKIRLVLVLTCLAVNVPSQPRLCYTLHQLCLRSQLCITSNLTTF